MTQIYWKIWAMEIQHLLIPTSNMSGTFNRTIQNSLTLLCDVSCLLWPHQMAWQLLLRTVSLKLVFFYRSGLLMFEVVVIPFGFAQGTLPLRSLSEAEGKSKLHKAD